MPLKTADHKPNSQTPADELPTVDMTAEELEAAGLHTLSINPSEDEGQDEEKDDRDIPSIFDEDETHIVRSET